MTAGDLARHAPSSRLLGGASESALAQADYRHRGGVLHRDVRPGWGLGLPITNHALALTVGGIAEKPGVVDGQMAIREYLDVTLSFDHDLLDGAPAAAFASAFKTLVEQGYGLNEEATSTGERQAQEVPV